MAAPKGNQYAKGKATGRPKIWTDEAIEEEADAMLEWIKDPKNLYIGVFAAQRGYNRARLSEFARGNKVFARAYDEAKQWQENVMLTNGLTRLWDPGFTSKAMARVCSDDWKNSWDKEEKDVKSSDLLDFLASLMSQAKSKDKPDANAGA